MRDRQDSLLLYIGNLCDMWASAPTECVRRGASDAAVRCGAGGYAIRPYEHAPGALVGAAFMAARTRFRFPPRFDDSARRRGAHGASATLRVQGTPPAALSSVHAVGADYISARAAPPVNVHFIPCGRCAMPGDRRRGRLQRARRSRSGARRWNKSSGPGTAP